MGFLDMFRKKESDPELQKLVEFAKDSKNNPEPHVDLALAYLAKVQTPPNWNQDYAKKAVNAFRKAGKIAKKHMRSEVEPIRDRFVESVDEVASAYRGYYEAEPDLKWLETAIWLWEQALSEVERQSVQSAKIREKLSDCWTQIAAWHEEKLKDESEGEDRLKKHVAAAEHALSYTDDVGTRAFLDCAVAGNQIAIGARYAERAGQSAVIGRQDGQLLKIDDREHKEYTRRAIRILRAGRTRLGPYSSNEDYGEMMAGANEALAYAYIMLYNLTWAHLKMSKSIGILQEAVRVVPNDADLWQMLAATVFDCGLAKLNDERIGDNKRGPSGPLEGDERRHQPIWPSRSRMTRLRSVSSRICLSSVAPRRRALRQRLLILRATPLVWS